MQAVQYLVQTVLQATPNGDSTELQPFLQQGNNVFHLWALVHADHVEVNPIVLLKIGGGEQVGHDAIGVNPVGTRHDNDAGWVLMIRLVPKVNHHGQLLLLHLCRNLFEDLRARDLVGQRVDHDLSALDGVGRAGLQGATSGPVELQDFVLGRDDLGFRGEIRALDDLVNVLGSRLRVVQQVNAGIGHFIEVVWRNIRRHTHGDTAAAIEQDVGQTGWQNLRLVQCAIEVGTPVDRTLA